MVGGASSALVFLHNARRLSAREATRRSRSTGQVKKLSDAIERIDREIRDPVVLELLLADEMSPMPTAASIDAVLREIRRRADIAASRLNLLGTGLDERLEELSDAAGLTTRELQDSEISEFLQTEQRGPPPANTEFGIALVEISRQAESALSAAYLATKAGKTKAGRARALLPTASSSRAFCAAVILEAWAYFHNGDYPPASNLQLAAAAEEYWRVCGGITEPWRQDKTDNKTLGAWRPYFKEASEPSLANTRKEIRRHVIESSTQK